ncbi:MerR family transcriptional regulator [Puia dinghuensis]|uniref:Heavy metal-responsive transcriptional regulator n=1 Tax=Puia dinghuensis TaxID=1792502 RepID=A0A8J2XSA2_9BACT|nr:MerR family transcriptional regulator [Puia dinghuensis]GGA93817.1 heavy metal-responsive transcriptional regulator [Puia dinghuensis]
MRIGELSKRSGFSRDTIRFYEKKGLIRLPDAGRDRYQFKDYPETILRRLLAIRQIKEFGFTLQETLGMIILFEEGVLEPQRGIRFVQRKIDRIDQKIHELTTIKNRLQQIVDTSPTGNCPLDKVLQESIPLLNTPQD